MKRRWYAHNLACLLLFCWAAAVVYAGPDVAAGPEAAPPPEFPLPDAQQMTAVLAGLPEQVEGCSLLAGPQAFDSEALAQYLGDRVNDLLNYEHSWTIRAEYAVATSEQTITLDVHRMGSDLEAFGVFSRRRTDIAKAAPAFSTSTYWLGSHLHVWRGPFYIHTHAASDDTALRPPMQQLTEAAIASIPVPSRLPAMLRLLPIRSRQICWAQYRRGQVPGFEVAADAVTVSYADSANAQCRFVLVRCADTASASHAYDKMLLQLSGDTHPAEPIPETADRAAVVQSGHDEIAALMQQDNFIAAVLDSQERRFAEALLRMTAANVRVYLLMEK